jgi:hypothetical protein
MRTFTLRPFAVSAAYQADPAQNLRQGDGNGKDSNLVIINMPSWDGTERRRGERRSLNRRQESQDVLLDTRASQDRRRQGRRATDRIPPGAFSFKA